MSSPDLDNEYDEFFDEHFGNLFQNCLDDYGNDQQPTTSRRPRAYIDRQHEEGHIQLWNDYFSENATFSAGSFRRRFRMNKSLFIRIVEALSNEVSYFQQRRDATKRLGLSGLQKCTTAIRILAYGCASDAVDEYLRLADSTAMQCLENFVEGIIYLFQDTYLRRPTSEDLQRLLNLGEDRGFPGMIGSIDCMHWEWKNCPTAWKGQYSRGSGKPTIVLEAVASQDLWIWHAFFGPPGTLNDINVLDRSPVFDDILEGRAPRVDYFVNGRHYNMAYYLTDGIYPRWATFIQSISLPQDPKASLFARCQEAARKDVERAFGVLQARFAIVKNPALFLDKAKIGKIMRACIILHNMIVEDERDGYSLYNTAEFHQREGSRTSRVDLTYSTDRINNLDEVIGDWNQVRDTTQHRRLKADLVEHIWQKFGTTRY
ncbi:PREDICTED: uncharacterized protein LOC104743171 [Camelina sativa]|uniref:Uncharacterized protein LOC104743171 n=1 Tax=Camelina sativa TaxID=90675 RepID=A0ABM0VXL4_CAMSA|nr:PREDICTED: uncharacterized protein LOC104743171 [Camelina sativa]